MRAFVVADIPAAANVVRNALVARGLECPTSHVLPLAGAKEAILRDAREADLVYVVLSPDVDRGLAVLQALKGLVPVRLVAIGSARDPRQILRVVHAGPDDYLDLDGDLESEVDASLRRLQTARAGHRERGKLVTVMSPSGGTGCSVLAANFAVALAEAHGRCLLCDLDLQRGDIASMFNLKPRFTVIDLCRNLQKLDQQMFDQSLLPHETGVSLLAAPRRFSDVQQVTSEAAEAVMEIACRNFPYVVVDLEDFFHREQFRVLQLSDVVLFVIRLDFGALRNARRTVDYLERAGVGRDKFRFVANQYGRPRELTPDQAAEALGTPITYFVPDDPKTVISALNRGIPALTDAPRSAFAKAVRKIAGEVFAEVPAET